MLEWNEINGFCTNLNYRGNVILPNLDEEVLVCRPDFNKGTRDIYVNAVFKEDLRGLRLYDLYSDGEMSILNGLKWARINKPFTENNTGYAIAFKDKFGRNFNGDIPNIVVISQSEIVTKINEFKQNGYKQVTGFKFIKPCTYEYDWEYVENNIVEAGSLCEE